MREQLRVALLADVVTLGTRDERSNVGERRGHGADAIARHECRRVGRGHSRDNPHRVNVAIIELERLKVAGDDDVLVGVGGLARLNQRRELRGLRLAERSDTITLRCPAVTTGYRVVLPGGGAQLRVENRHRPVLCCREVNDCAQEQRRKSEKQRRRGIRIREQGVFEKLRNFQDFHAGKTRTHRSRADKKPDVEPRRIIALNQIGHVLRSGRYGAVNPIGQQTECAKVFYVLYRDDVGRACEVADGRRRFGESLVERGHCDCWSAVAVVDFVVKPAQRHARDRRLLRSAWRGRPRRRHARNTAATHIGQQCITTWRVVEHAHKVRDGRPRRHVS